MAIKIINPIINTVDPTLQEKTITENGEYTADEGYDGLSKVTVEVESESKLPQVVDKTVTEITASDLSGATKIGNRVFSECKNLARITIPEGVTTIEGYAFYYDSKLASVTIPESITQIDDKAFNFCTALKSVYITDIAKYCGITFGGSNAPPTCNKADLYLNGEIVTDLVIPDTVTEIGTYCFYGCRSLTSVTIPDGVTSLSWAFNSCSNLKRVTMGSGITNVGQTTFRYCSALELVDFRKATAVPTLPYTNAFDGVPTTCQIVVPDALYDEWIAATNWATYASYIYKASEVTIE